MKYRGAFFPFARLAFFVVFAATVAAAAEVECLDWVTETFIRDGHRAPRSPASLAAADLRTIAAHSHNDYEQPRPLDDALAHRFESVEADIWFTSGSLKVSHSGWDDFGTLRELYLEPLQKRVKTLGSVYGDGRPFYLWLDIKYGMNVKDFADAIHRELDPYSMLTVFTDGVISNGPVTVILTGNGWVKNAFFERSTVRRACRDRHEFALDDPPADNRWKWYSLRWNNYFEWDGSGRMPLREATRLKSLVEAIHAKGRRIRFWHGPETPAFWQTLASAGVDMIDTNRLASLRSVLPYRQ